MDLRTLRYFAAAVEDGSMQRAAARLNMAQPALSRRIRDLEEELGCTLLTRGTRGVTPTPAGIALFRRALAILDEVENAGRAVRRMGLEQARNPRLGLAITARKYGFLREAVRACAAAAGPEVSYGWGPSADLAEGLAEGRFDAALLYGWPHGGSAFHERLIHRERFILAVHPDHRLAGRGPLDLSDLAGEPLVWLSRRDDTGDHDHLRQQCRIHGFEPLIGYTAASHVEQVDVTVISGGVCLTAATTTLTVPEGMLLFRPLPQFDAGLRLSLGWRDCPPGSNAAALLAALDGAIDKHRADIASGAAAWSRLDGHPIVVLD